MKDFVEHVVKALVKHPDQVTVSPVDRQGCTYYELRMESGDVGRVVGRSGKTINAIRALLAAGGARKGIRCALEIIEDSPSR